MSLQGEMLISWREHALDFAEVASPYVAEFLGTFFVVVTMGCNARTGDLVWMPTSVAFSIMVGMSATKRLSGGHLNPSISLAFGLVRKMPWPRVIGYCIAQVAAGIAGGHLVNHVLQQGLDTVVAAKGGFDFWDSLVAEIIYTVIMCFVALNCMASVRNNPTTETNQYSGLAVGFVAIAGGHAVHAISGAFFNPAITLGFALNSPSDLRWALAFVGYQCAASVLAAALFLMVRPEELMNFGASASDRSEDRLGCGRACAAVCPCGRRPFKSEQEEQSAETVEQAMANYRPRVPVRLLSEFLGTYAVVITYGLSSAVAQMNLQHGSNPLATGGPGAGSNLTIGGSIPAVNATVANATASLNVTKASGGALSTEAHSEFSVVHWATGAAVVSMVYALGSVSGAHLNPAVTVAATCSGRDQCSVPEAVTIVACQAGAGLVAALTYTCMARGRKLTSRDIGPGAGYDMRSAAFGECAFTLAVAFVVLCTTTVRSPRYAKAPTVRGFQAALAIGLCVAAGGFAIETVTGGVLNPAITVAVSAGNVLAEPGFDVLQRTHMALSYSLWECLGGAAAALLFVLSHPWEYKPDPLFARGRTA